MTLDPRTGTKDTLDHNNEAGQRRDGVVNYYKGAMPEGDSPIIRINGRNGGVDIGGTDGMAGLLVVRDKDFVIRYLVKGAEGSSGQTGDVVLYEVLADGSARERIRLSGTAGQLTIVGPQGVGTALLLDGTWGLVEVGAAELPATLKLNDAAGKPALLVEADVATAKLGSDRAGGVLQLLDKAGDPTIHMQASPQLLDVGKGVHLDGMAGKVQASDQGVPGATLNGPARTLELGTEITLDGKLATAAVGKGATTGRLSVAAGTGAEIVLSGADQRVSVAAGVVLDGKSATVSAGSGTQSGKLHLKSGNVTPIDLDSAGAVARFAQGQILLEGNDARITAGNEAKSGEVIVKATGGGVEAAIRGTGISHFARRVGIGTENPQHELHVEGTVKAGTLDATSVLAATVTATTVTADNVHGDVKVSAPLVDTGKVIAQDVTTDTLICHGALGAQSITAETLNGAALVGCSSIQAKSIDISAVATLRGVNIVNAAGTSTIQFDNERGDIALQLADCAEDFDLAPAAAAEPGTVMVLCAQGAVQPSAHPYDHKVAGIVSGAGSYRAGLILDRRLTPGGPTRIPLALMGKTYCKVDATFGAIETGDLLTTSPTAGHAMKVSDRTLAAGAIVGKALAGLPAGSGLIPILVTLQ